MDLDEQLKLAHLLLEERTCREGSERKNHVQTNYRVHKNVKLISSYSYECKECTIKRIVKTRKQSPPIVEGYPDW